MSAKIYVFFICVEAILYLLLYKTSYRNQSVDLLCKSIDWFLSDGNFGV